MSKVKADDTVQIHYTGKLTDGNVFDSSREREPLEFTLGQGEIIPGFEQGILDMEVNETKTIEVPHTEAYGERKDELLHEVPKDQLPEEIKPEVGMALSSKMPDGREIPLTVTEVGEEKIVVDANHPLAGKDLTFEVEVVAIK
ncbi:MAG: peptidylprolyl isomerase [Schleiferiaceae bacterium]|jgi:FKBP-type peptidyl-prolyl cis-trans isomerase SlpA|nr:peptidylprolyl isomerase [Schleiferiaceae bacterium]MDR9443167.1 peptidylprolyl isomerase [Schleiferiaceae bacterium]